MNQNARIRNLCLVAALLANTAITPFAAADQGRLEELAQSVTSYKDRLLRTEEGVTIEYEVDVSYDPTDDFGSRTPITVRTIVKWPLYFVSSQMWLKASPAATTRVSVHDFETNVSIQHDEREAAIMPGRSMFSAAESYLLRWMHYGEGFQQYHANAPSTDMDSIPECFSSGSYVVRGPAKLDGVGCLLVERGEIDRI